MTAACIFGALVLIDFTLACAWLGVHIRRDNRSDARLRQFVCDQTIARINMHRVSGT